MQRDEREGEREGEWASERKGGTARARRRGFAQGSRGRFGPPYRPGKRVTIPEGHRPHCLFIIGHIASEGGRGGGGTHARKATRKPRASHARAMQ